MLFNCSPAIAGGGVVSRVGIFKAAAIMKN